MLLDIIVPHYNEPIEIVQPFFSVLDSQKGVDFNDFRVWLLHNGDVTFYPKVNNLQLCIQLLDQPGVSHARNYGIDQADAEWICFCDCDDSYTSIFSLMKIFHVLKDENAKNFDLIWGSFFMCQDDRLIISDKPNNIFIHNKYYRLSFLKEHDIRFNEKIRMSEDSAFNTIVRWELGERRMGQIDNSEPLYAWCRRPGSITMDPKRWIDNTEGHFERNLYILDEYRFRLKGDSDLMVARTLTDVYAMLNKHGVIGDQTRILSRAGNFYKENKILFERVPKEKVKEALNASERDVCTNDLDRMNRPSFEEWLKIIETA